MKKEVCLVIFLMSIFLVGIVMTIRETTAEKVTGRAVTGEATQTVGMNISVISTNTPTLTIEFPENKTYMINESFPIHFSVSNADVIWYNLDNSDNTTITSSVYINLSQGSHTLYLYANNSNGITTKNVTFNVNLNLFNYSHDEYEGNYKGESSYFKNLSYIEIQNISNFILEHTSYGKISFNEIINLTNFDGSMLDLDSYTNISLNRVEIDTSFLSNFNKSATLRLYNLTLTNPRIAKDGVVCPSTICVKQSYSEGILVFNVTHFTTYSAEETPAGEETSASSGGGVSVKKDFSIDKEKIKISLKQGETKRQEITIKNTGNTKIKINLENLKLKDFIKISETSFDLDKGESKTITLDFTARKNTIPDLYQGRIIVKEEGIEKEVAITIEVETEKPLFYAEIEIPEKFLHIIPGENITINILLYNIEEIEEVSVGAEYMIKDEDDSIMVKEQENLTAEIHSPAKFAKTFKLPLGIEPGDYIFYVKIIYQEETAIASAWFTVGKPSLSPLKQKYIISILIIFIIILSIILIIRKLKKHGKTKRKDRMKL